MSSPFDKYLWAITVPAGGWDFSWLEGSTTETATVAAGTYDSILELADELQSKMSAEITGSAVVEVSQVGIITISTPDMGDLKPLSSDADLYSLLGYTGSEGVYGLSVEATYQHLYGYYPGCLSWGYTSSDGTGRTSAGQWWPAWSVVSTIAGNHEMRRVGPSSASEKRELRYGMIHKGEVEDDERGLRAFLDSCIVSQFRWYPDRSLGTVTAPGTQDTDYYLCAFVREPQVQETRSRDHRTWSVILNKEPTS